MGPYLGLLHFMIIQRHNNDAYVQNSSIKVVQATVMLALANLSVLDLLLNMLFGLSATPNPIPVFPAPKFVILVCFLNQSNTNTSPAHLISAPGCLNCPPSLLFCHISPQQTDQTAQYNNTVGVNLHFRFFH